MTDIAVLPWRNLAQSEDPDFPVGTLMIGEPEHRCCHEAAIRQLNVFVRGDGSRLQQWDLVAEFCDLADAEICLKALNPSQT